MNKTPNIPYNRDNYIIPLLKKTSLTYKSKTYLLTYLLFVWKDNYLSNNKTRQSEMADLARRATRWVGTLSDGNVHVKFHDDRLRNGGDITY